MTYGEDLRSGFYRILDFGVQSGTAIPVRGRMLENRGYGSHVRRSGAVDVDLTDGDASDGRSTPRQRQNPMMPIPRHYGYYSERGRCDLDGNSYGPEGDYHVMMGCSPSRQSHYASRSEKHATNGALPPSRGRIKSEGDGIEAALDVEMALSIPVKEMQCGRTPPLSQQTSNVRPNCLAPTEALSILIMGGGAWVMSRFPVTMPRSVSIHELFNHVGREENPASQQSSASRITLWSGLDEASLPILLAAIAAYAISAGSQYYRLRDHQHIDMSLVSSLTGGFIGGLLFDLDLVRIILAVLPWCIMTALALCMCT